MTAFDRRRFLARTGAVASAALGSRAFAQPLRAFDILVKGGTVIDPSRSMQARADVAIRAGRIAAVEADVPASPGTRVIDARGKIVTAGLIDLRAHFDPSGTSGRREDALLARHGVTTAVSAGDAGTEDFKAFRRHVASRTAVRIYAFVHLGAAGTRVGPSGRDAPDPVAMERAAQVIAGNHDMVLGVRIRPPRSNEEAGVAAITHAIDTLERAQVRGRIMYALEGGPGPAHAALERLRPGDILTHTYGAGVGSVLQGAKIVPAARAARERGVIIEAGAGRTPMDLGVAAAALEQGFVPDVISSGFDAAAGADAAMGLPAVMSLFLELGLELEHVVALATSNPGRLIGREAKLGTLQLDAPGDVTIFELTHRSAASAATGLKPAARWLQPVTRIHAGVVR
ncbi:MAG: amidohydrolase [Burkholderiales bacterium]|nr:amidohydrolase [Burkholderiales bacterium]